MKELPAALTADTLPEIKTIFTATDLAVLSMNMQPALCMKTDSKERRKIMRKTAETNNELFDKFWKSYPRKEGKPQALRTFEKLGIDETIMPQLLLELERQSKMKDWKHINTKFIPLAQTWLNRRDWEEEQNEASKYNDTADQYGAVIC